MTTRVTVKNEEDSNPLQELVVTAHNTALGDKPAINILAPGEHIDFWVSSSSLLQITERQKT